MPLPFNIEKLRLCVITLLHSYEVAFIRFCVVTLCRIATIADTIARLRRPSVIRPVVIHVMDYIPAVAVVADVAQGSIPHLHAPALAHAPLPQHPRSRLVPADLREGEDPTVVPFDTPRAMYSPSGRHSTRAVTSLIDFSPTLPPYSNLRTNACSIITHPIERMPDICKTWHCEPRCHQMAPNDPAQELRRWDSYLMATPG